MPPEEGVAKKGEEAASVHVLMVDAQDFGIVPSANALSNLRRDDGCELLEVGQKEGLGKSTHLPQL
jgi:hypothetical protein